MSKKKTKVEVWYQPGITKYSTRIRGRTRIISSKYELCLYHGDWFNNNNPKHCCWNYHLTTYCSIAEKRDVMHRYDRDLGYTKAIKVAEWYE